MDAPTVMVLAIVFDVCFGDPRWLPHPVQAVGAAYAALDTLADRLGWRTRRFGALGVVLVAGGSGLLVYGVSHVPGWLGMLASLYFAYAGLALGGLLRHGRRAARYLEAEDLPAARQAVGGLVSRDVTGADAPALWRALAESVAENANDAFVAPLFWLAIGGPGLLWAYKAVSTADSMWGYRTERHGLLGWFGARADDVMAWLPARLTVMVMLPAAWLLGAGRDVSLHRIVADARKSASPNAGWPMAAAAWLCGCSMGGPSLYFGQVVHKPEMGPHGTAWNAKRFALLTRIVLLTCVIVSVITFSFMKWSW